MRRITFTGSLLAAAAAVALAAPAAFAQQEQDCQTKLETLEQRVEQVDLSDAARNDFDRLIEQARTFEERGETPQCLRLAEQAERQLPEQAQQGQRGEQQGQQSEEQAQQTQQQEQAGEQAKAEQEAEMQTPGRGYGDDELAAPGARELADNPQEYVNTRVYTEEGDTIGKVEALVRATGDGKMFYVMDHGGFLGIGQKEIALPVERFRVGEQDRLIAPGLSEEELDAMEEYDATMYEEIAR